ncbi:MAG: phosphoribosylformylglycinamidine synthase subunit PurQ [Candidatus Marinimicrobia bacterium]|nr:phosphoribosylformylglycinamidine synthase subunit PurQ [Candidatus Neomarinimicrobiota bacterium]
MRVAVLVFPGSNCDQDAYHAIKNILGAEAEFVWHREKTLSGFDAVIIPGGFSYGDYLRSGAIARFAPIMAAVKKLADAGAPIMGICNGFQILVEAGMLPGALISNASLRFVSRMVALRPEHTDSPFTSALDSSASYAMPVAHQSGNFAVSPDQLAAMEEHGQIAFRYVDARGKTTAKANPNGSTGHIAGVLNKRRNVLGLMPHPERAVEALMGSADGLELFKSMMGAA